MTQEDRELLFKDLCTRLPYGIKASYYGAEEEREIWDEIEGITLDGYVDIGQYSLPIEGIKPYLYPLSSMTKEQLFEVQEILGKNEIKIEYGFLHIVDSDRNTITYLEILALLNWFYKNHFDINGLISMDLAIDATNLNIYKTSMLNNPQITIGTKICLKSNPDEILTIISGDCHEDKFECSDGSVLSLKQIKKYYDII